MYGERQLVTPSTLVLVPVWQGECLLDISYVDHVFASNLIGSAHLSASQTRDLGKRHQCVSVPSQGLA